MVPPPASSSANAAAVGESTSTTTSATAATATATATAAASDTTPHKGQADLHKVLGSNPEKHVSSFYGQLTGSTFHDPDHGKATIAAESRYSRFLRWLAYVAGIVTPLGEKEYAHALALCGSEERIRNEYITDATLHTQLMLNMPEGTVQYDWYDICKESKTWFVCLLLAIYFLVLVLFFGAIGEECFIDNATAGQFIPRAFSLISGFIQYDEPSTFCAWMNVGASFFGVYISLPLLGAVLLVRLLAPMGSPPNLSKHMILRIKNGMPELSFRVNNSNGRVVTGLEIDLNMWIVSKDTHEDKRNAACFNIKLNYGSKWTSGGCSRAVHVVDDDSPLKKLGVVVFDENGIPKMDHSKIGVIEVMACFDSEWGGRKLFSMRNYFNTRYYIVEGFLGEEGSEDEGKIMLPDWQSMAVTMAVKWRTSKGTHTPTADNNLMNLIKFVPYKPRDVPLMANE